MSIRVFLLLAALAALPVAAQTPASVTLTVKETVGIRRFGYPASVRVPFPQGALRTGDAVGLARNGAAVPVQVTGEAAWPDGSVQWLAVDFNAGIGPNEMQTYQLQYGTGATAASLPRGLVVTEDDTAVRVGSARFSKTGAPLLLSVHYRHEDVAGPGTEFAVTDSAGKRFDFKGAEPARLEILKRGPLNAVLRYTGRLALDAGYSAPYVVTVEMPSSKTWVKVTAAVDDPGKRLRTISYRTPLALGSLPWVWDMGTERWTYGTLNNRSDSVEFAETVKTGGMIDWQVDTGPRGKEQPYEIGPLASKLVRWWHIQDGKEVVAFAVGGDATEPGKYRFAFGGDGVASIDWATAEPRAHHELTVFEHFVMAPVQIGAVTSPNAMLSPLTTTCDPRQFALSRVPSPKRKAKRQ